MRLLLDGSFGRSVRDALVNLGHDVELADLVSGAPLSDDDLVAMSAETGRALVTLDEHFANPLRFDPSRTGGMIVVSLPDEHPASTGAPTERIEEMRAEVMRSVADLERELDQLERELRAVDDEAALLRKSAEDAATDGVMQGAAELDAALRTAESRRASLTAGRDALRAARDQAEATVQRLTARYYEVVVKHVSDTATRLVEHLGDSGAGPDRSAAEEVRHDAAVAASADVRELLQLESDPAFRAANTKATLAARLGPTWGSIARELALALARFLSVAEERDPTGKLWLVAADGMLELGQPTRPPA